MIVSFPLRTGGGREEGERVEFRWGLFVYFGVFFCFV